MTNEMMKATWEKVSRACYKVYVACEYGQLNRCKAWMYGVEIDNKLYVVLKSYNTVVAIWDVEENIVIDALREVYGYTSTSAQHIRKFVKWVTARRIDCKPCVYRVITWNDIKRIQYEN